jgi:hypothetical protein
VLVFVEDASGAVASADVEGADNPCDVRGSLLVALRLIYMVVWSLLAWARLSRRDAAAKNVEMLEPSTSGAGAFLKTCPGLAKRSGMRPAAC